MKSMTVLSVISGPPDAVVGLDFGGPNGYKKLRCSGLMYAPQKGDTVLVDYLGNRPYIVRCMTDGRTWVPSSLDLIVSNTAPTDPDYQLAGQVYGKAGKLWLVRDTPVVAPTVTRVIARPIAARTWDPVNGWDGANRDQRPKQGSWGGGFSKGLWFYDPADLAAVTGSGWTARMQVRRYGYGGDPSGPIQLQVWHHGYLSPPGGEPVISNQVAPAGADPGRTDLREFDVDPATVAAFVAGTAKGMAIGSASTADYLIALGPVDDTASGVITFTRSV